MTFSLILINLIFISQNLIIKPCTSPNFSNSHYQTFFCIYTSSYETKIFNVSKVVIMQLVEYKLQDYYQINVFPISGYRMTLQRKATNKESRQVVREQAGSIQPGMIFKTLISAFFVIYYDGQFFNNNGYNASALQWQ